MTLWFAWPRVEDAQTGMDFLNHLIPEIQIKAHKVKVTCLLRVTQDENPNSLSSRPVSHLQLFS